MSQDASTLARSPGWRRLAVPLLLAVSLGCNLTALVIPFVDIDVFLKGTTRYSLPRSVQLMWEADLYFLALLVVAFSIVFPFAKLAAQGWVWFFMTEPGRRRRLLERIEPLGKWSFLDIYIVCIIFILTNDQLFIGAETRAGLYFFIAAIGLSMTSAAIIEPVVDERQPRDGRRRSLAAEPGWQRRVVPVLLVVAMAAVLLVFNLPFLKVSQFLFAGHAHSILHSVPALWDERAYVLAAMVAVTLVAAPLAAVLTMAVAWFTPFSGGARHAWRRVVQISWQCAMLDVFGLALLVFLLEGNALIKTEIKPGLYMLVGAIAVLTASYLTVEWSNRRLLKWE